MITEKLGLDDKDVKLISLMMDNPQISQSEIAEKLSLSQPSVFVRLQKLRKKGLIESTFGLSFSKTGLFVSRVDMTCSNPTSLLAKLKDCPFFVNGFIMSGRNNVSIMLVHEDLKKIDEIVNSHIRIMPNVTDISVNLLVSAAKDFVFNMKLEHACDNPCKKCPMSAHENR